MYFQPLSDCPNASWSGSGTSQKRHTGFALVGGFDFSKKYKIDVDPDDIHYVNARLTLHFNGPSP